MIVLLLTAALVWFGEGLHPLWPLAWLSPVAVLVLAFRRGPLRGGLIAFAGWTLGRLSMLHLMNSLHLPIPIMIVFVALPAAIAGLCVALSAALVRRALPWHGVVALPAAWVAFEYVASFGPDGTMGARAYFQMDCLPIVQLASLTGVWGISFVVAFAASAAAVGWHLRSARFPAVAVGVIVLVVTYGEFRLAHRSETTLRVGQAASMENDPAIGQAMTGDPAGVAPILDGYSAQVDALARQGAKLVVLPEEIAGAKPDGVAAIRDRLGAIAASDGVTLVAGLRLIEQPKGRNVALVFSPSGALMGTYVKEHLIAGFERPSLNSGTDLVVIDAPVRTGIEVCKDMDFPALTGRYSDSGVALLVAPAWDFREDGWLHSRMAIMRGIEQGLPLVRSAQSGLLTVSDAHGRVLAETETGPREAMQVVDVPVGHQRTLYQQSGDWFAFATLAMLAWALTGLLRRSTP